MISQTTRDKWWHSRELLDAHQSELSDWELGFFESICDRLDSGLGLTFGQSKKLREIAKEYDG